MPESKHVVSMTLGHGIAALTMQLGQATDSLAVVKLEAAVEENQADAFPKCTQRKHVEDDVPDGRQEGRGVQGTWGQAHREVENAGKELMEEVRVTIRQTLVRWRRWQTGMRT